MEKGTRIIIDGVPYIIDDIHSGSLGKYMLIITHDTTNGTDIREGISRLLEELDEMDDNPFSISQRIVSWFVDEKLKAGVSLSAIFTVKRNPKPAELQIRRLLKSGEPVETIVELLAFALSDKFWSGVLNTSINTFATSRNDEIMLYQKIKNRMITDRQFGIVENHQETEAETDGIIYTE